MDPQSELVEAVRSVLPSGWSLVPYEPSDTPNAKLPDRQAVYVKIRSVRRSTVAPAGAFDVDWVLTLMTQYPARETADPQLSKDLLTFLIALENIDDSRFGLIEAAEKTVGSDLDRLAYDITVRMIIAKKKGA